MNNKKVFRVLMTDTISYYHDVEAETREEAMSLAQDAIDSGEVTFSEDYSAYEGYKLHDAQEIERAKSDLA